MVFQLTTFRARFVLDCIHLDSHIKKKGSSKICSSMETMTGNYTEKKNDPNTNVTPIVKHRCFTFRLKGALRVNFLNLACI